MQNRTWRTLSEPPLVSALCVTEDRPEFIPWLLWNHAKQDHPRRELIIVDSSREALTGSESEDVRVISCAPGTTVARKRNLALRAARGDLITWFDDDDWQHPRKLSILAAALSGGVTLAGSRTGWFLDLRRNRVRPYTSTRHLIFNSIGARAAVAVAVPFDEAMVRASDTAWLTGLRRTGAATAVIPEILSVWLCHRRNLSNPASRYVFPRPLSDLELQLGHDSWAGTPDQLERLRSRLACT